MDGRCRCTSAARYDFEQLACIECGAPCCPECATSLESVTYCAHCAGRLLGAQPAPSPRRFELQ